MSLGQLVRLVWEFYINLGLGYKRNKLERDNSFLWQISGGRKKRREEKWVREEDEEQLEENHVRLRGWREEVKIPSI
jgi:hypothetical protein